MPADPLAEEALGRLRDARRQKEAVADDLREAYYFTRPRLSRRVRSDTAPETPFPTPEKDDHELTTGVGTEVNEDFATELINAFFPRSYNWAASKAGPTVPPEVWAEVKDAAEAADTAVFQEINASNFAAELATAMIPDAGIGTIALWIDEARGFDPIRCLHVPLRELEINVGADGNVDDRFAVRFVRARSIGAVLDQDLIPAKVKRWKREKPEKWVEVVWGFWRDFTKPRQTAWKQVILVDGELVLSEEIRGEGCLPLIVMRFGPDAMHSFGNGPTIDALPDLRVVDAMTEAQMNRAFVANEPPFAFPDDGVMNFEGGLRPGMAYPKRPGAVVNDIVPLYFEGDLSFGVLTLDELIRRIRRRHFSDFPEQPGKTPPTATQWIDEMVKSQRRIGTPGLRFWQEGPAQVFKRFQYLAVQRGTVAPLLYDGRMVSTQPVNPATQAQEQQEVQIGTRFLEILGALLPSASQAIVDQVATARNIKEKLGDKIVTLRSDAEAQQLIEQMMAIAGPALAGQAGQNNGAANGAMSPG